MATDTKTCPACKTKIDKKSDTCPSCGKQLEILYWEIEQASGEKMVLAGGEAEITIRDDLLAKKLTLSDPCRQIIKKLSRVVNGQDVYVIKEEKPLLKLKDYANSVFELQVLYNPASAYGKLVAKITGVWSVLLLQLAGTQRRC